MKIDIIVNGKKMAEVGNPMDFVVIIPIKKIEIEKNQNNTL